MRDLSENTEKPAIGMDRALSLPDLEFEDAGGHDDEAHNGAESGNGDVMDFRHVKH
ncbi:BnaAnng11760D [Brassica napus]|uniref:BnaAnng11760D protein n=1 Tax=Brassica napus TaxID=3708 RepID=A0A078ITR1_BRANA|nr:BnaAnng11760D [Brassica napus]